MMHQALFGAVLLVSAASAHAAITVNVNATYQSGATYIGTVTFANDFQSMLATTGVLTGYAEGSFTFTSIADSSVINWVWPSGNNGNENFSGDPTKFSTFLMSGTEPSWGSFVVFSVLTSGAPTLSFSDSAFQNSINYEDLLVSGSISAVPEPASWAMLIAGFGLVGAAARRRRSVQVVTYAQ